MIEVLPTGRPAREVGAAGARPRAIAVEAIGVVTPDRYGRIVAYAQANSLEPGAVLDLATGVRVYPPERLPTNGGRPTAVRREAEGGRGSWPEVVAEMEASAPEVIGRAWDGAGYAAFLASGDGISFRWQVVAALRRCLAAGIPVVLTVTSPPEFAAGMRAILSGVGLPVVLTCESGVHKHDGALWDACLHDHASEATRAELLVIEDAWEHCATAAEHGATAWWIDGDDDVAALVAALDGIVAAG